MKQTSIFSFLVLLLPVLVTCVGKQAYIVYFGEHKGDKTHKEIEENHQSYLFSVKDSEEEAKASLLYSYKHSINGFAAVLTPDQASKLSELDEVVSVIPSDPRAYSLHTTRSWEFLDVRKGLKRNSTNKNDFLLKAGYGKNVIVGLLDGGIWPESRSFSDKGMGTIPKSWKGICQDGDSFNSSLHCNKKIIGARYYLKGYESYYGHPVNRTENYRSPRDKDGHGTHTSSIVGGRIVHAKALGGFAHGTASGGAPLAHLAMYKACWVSPGGGGGSSCLAEDMLAALDDAISDGVHVLSISIGYAQAPAYSRDAIAIGSLHAVKNGIVVSCSAGNKGASSIVSNPAPWIITVGASSVDRAFPAPVLLGNGKEVQGEAVTPYKLEEKMYPLVNASTVQAYDDWLGLNGYCIKGTLSPEKTKGKMVLCFRGYAFEREIGEEVKRAGGVGFILANTREYGDELTPIPHLLPATDVGYTEAIEILNYIKSTHHPTAYVHLGRTVLDQKPAPYVDTSSCTGPSDLTPDILKPDIVAPGVDILGASSEGSSTPKTYEILSGTSFSCPHVAAAAALLKAIHPTWSPGAIRSALMTTATQTNNIGKPITDGIGVPANPFLFGSGHLQPTKAADPGLVYDVSSTDYFLFLCNFEETKGMVDKSFKCPKKPPSPSNLNYPSLAISNLNGTVTVKRTVTNVGDCGTTYFLDMNPPRGVSVKISPSVLGFDHTGEKKSFTITIQREYNKTGKDDYVFGWYSWTDGIHVVRSPMAVNLK